MGEEGYGRGRVWERGGGGSGGKREVWGEVWEMRGEEGQEKRGMRVGGWGKGVGDEGRGRAGEEGYESRGVGGGGGWGEGCGR